MKKETAKEGNDYKLVRYGIWQEDTPRYGRCWRFNIRVRDVDGRTLRKAGSGFATKAECETAVAALRLAAREASYGLSRPKPETAITIGAVVDAYLRALKARWTARHGAGYAERNKGQINALERWVDFAGRGKAVKDVTKQDFALWAERELGRGLQASSVQRRLNNIRAALNDAIETRKELHGFTLPRYSVGREAKRERMRILDESEIRALSRFLQSRKEYRDAFGFFRVVLGTGGRFDEIAPAVVRRDMSTAGIKWTDINKNRGTIRLFSGKTGKERTIYVPAVVDVLLERRKDKLGGELHAFTCRDHWIRKIFARASRHCGIPYGQQVPGGWTVHDLRHTCLTHLLQSGVDLATVRDFAGHSTIAETSRYVHATERSKTNLAQASSGLITIASSNA